MRKALPVVLLVAAFPLLGCGPVRKIKECGKVTGTINDGVTKAKAAVGSGPAGPAELRKIAEVYDGLAADMGKIEVTTPEVKKEADEYQTMAREVARAAREAAAATESRDKPKVVAARADFDKVRKQEEDVVGRINTVCGK
jgi:hypothetical protein